MRRTMKTSSFNTSQKVCAEGKTKHKLKINFFA
ncbi:MAG: hypothetical protein JJP05_03065 [cyanobacterium endosymbiont of Rhopalodia gibba]|jgi:hypothetical protein